MEKTGQHYPCGPCELPLECSNCGEIITEDNQIDETCEEDCEICEYCGSGSCPNCGYHWHCGGCI